MNVQEEAQAILDLVAGDLSRAVQIVQNQLDVLHSRAQVLTSLAGIVVTVTGFSGRLIAATNQSAQFLVIIGLAVVLGSAFFVIRRVMQLHWVTSELSADKAATIARILVSRDKKTRAIRIGGLMLFSGLFFYFVAFALMLANPVPVTLPAR
ncbi:MAG: hypothetical protein ACOYM3_05075 [Terrimicrobiaceae bacterium]